MPWRVTSRKTGLSAVAPERDAQGREIQYAFHAFEVVGPKIGADGFADCICTQVAPDVTPKANGHVEISEPARVA